MAILTSPTDGRTDEQAYARRWWTLAVLCLSLLIVFGGNSTLNVALPTLSRDLGASESQLQWVVAIYSLVFAGLLFTTGALGDRFGRKGALQFGLVTFFVASLLASQATDVTQIIACRAAMGVGAAFIMPSTLSILVNVFPPHERAKAIAIWATTTGIAGSVGPVITGYVLGHFWFGSAFLVYLPVIAMAIIGGWFFVPKSRDPNESAIDPLGALLSIVGVSALVYGFIEAPDKGWVAPVTIGAFAIAAVVLTLFVLWELRAKSPMLDMHYFRNPAFSVGSGAMMLVFLAMYGVMLLMTQYFQLVLGFSALDTAIRLLPIALIMLVVTPFTPRIVQRFGGNRSVGFGMCLIALGFGLFTQLSIDTPFWYCWLCLTPLMTGVSLSMSPMTSSIMSAVPESRAGAGSAMNDATRELGAALGIAVLGSIAASQYSSHLHDALGKIPASVRGTASSSIAGALQVAEKLPGRTGAAFATAAQTAFVDGIHVAALFGVALAIAAALVTRKFLPRTVAPIGPMHSGVEALENAAELGLGGAMPVFADTADAASEAEAAESDSPEPGEPRRTLHGVTTTGTEPTLPDAAAPSELRILVSFDIDGTMEFGDPPGPVPAEVARELVGRGYIVGVASDWPRSSQQPLWSRHGVEPEFVGGKHHLHEVKAQFPADRYVHVGDTDVDERYALLAGFEFLHVDELVEPVVADDIHDAAWVPPT